MRARRLFSTVAIVGIFAPALGFAGDAEWRRYVIPSTGTSVDMPVSIFTMPDHPRAEPAENFSRKTAAPI